MSAKIKSNFFNFLFRLFSFLADKTGGWKVFVRPKLLFGALIVGVGMTACSSPPNDPDAPQITCYDVGPGNTIQSEIYHAPALDTLQTPEAEK